MLGAIWEYILQNVLPPSIWSILAVILSHFATHRKLNANHDDMKQHVTAATGGSDGQDPS